MDREQQIRMELTALKIDLNSTYGTGLSDIERYVKMTDRVTELRKELLEIVYPKSESMKSNFVTYFDGCYEIDPTPDTPSTYQMGVCKLEYNSESNTLMVHLRRPGLLIGKAGRTIDACKEHLECDIAITEVKKF